MFFCAVAQWGNVGQQGHMMQTFKSRLPTPHRQPLNRTTQPINRYQNQLNMGGACINVAQSNEFQSVWDGQPPADFATDLAALASAYGAVQADAAAGGAADQKAAAEAALEDAAYILTRALANHFRKTGDLERRGKVDFTRSEIKQLRAQDLAARAASIRDIGTASLVEPAAAARGITPARLASLTAALDAYTPLMNLPRGQLVNRSTLLKEI